MPIRHRAAALVGAALTATALTGVAAVAAPPGTDSPIPSHMTGLDDQLVDDMATMMEQDATIGQMHQWMVDNDLSIGQMHRGMAQAGTSPGSMHRTMAR